jgi:hypothetical protein
MIYIDQPIGVGFSYGTNQVDSTVTAAPLVWKLLQAFYTKFPEYGSRDFAIFTESYGGHYGPGFVKYILNQNTAIAKGTAKGTKINMVALGLNNAWINPYDNYKGMIDFSLNNTYRRLITPAQAQQYQRNLDNRCKPALDQCWSSGTNPVCSRAVTTCKVAIEDPLSRIGGFDVYDVRKPKGNKFPPQTYEKWLQQPGVQQSVGAKKRFDECPSAPLRKFMQTGDGKHRIPSSLWAVGILNLTPRFRLSELPPSPQRRRQRKRHSSHVGRRQRLDLQLDVKLLHGERCQVSRASRVPEDDYDAVQGWGQRERDV